MIKVGACFVDARDRVTPRRWARAESGELRKDIPHPVGALVPVADFGECSIVIAFLRFDESMQMMQIVYHKSTGRFTRPVTSEELRADRYTS